MRLSERINQGSTSNLLESININLKESNNDVDIVSYNLTNGGYSNNANTVYGKLSDDTAYVYYPEMDLIEIYDEVPIELLHILYYNSENEDELPEDEYQRLVKEYQDAHLINTIHDGPLFDKLHDKYYADDEVEEVYSDLDENTLTEDIDTFDEFKAGVENASSLYNFIYNEFGTMSKELLKEIALDAIYHLKNDEVIINDIKERFFNVYESEEPEKCDTEVKDNETNLNESSMASKYAKFCKSMELDPKDLDAVLEALDNLEGMEGDTSGEYQEIREYIYNDLMK